MTEQRERPWWASDGREDIGDEDPFDAHQRARQSTSGVGADAFRELFRVLGDGRHRLDSPTCGICPLCTAIASLDRIGPEIAHHLSEAARHMTLAAKSFVDAQTAAYGPTNLEHIEVEDEDGDL